ncbi:hypothetical protein SPRG_22213 [Saprolegnia parasitica CBS 223.65]|uniref:Uncharacterized protein n=1 Tax=Saprolegnia parasitica (strain CBS 223.65) TaxID=695850 RepID=A0A067CI75_SAPPC|nr:hypothetical protein SPRG_22213 [Saprolegnia parasitica CBS 223.65]KDO26522.1 hypothetical protein SPRG_22213 [Saprolegnia parasitica CBS 223.65]|eukprot:XP_012202797.1 hypothetical protein SPRG_22213 [Saprolegnia parasitica CBS 223.65]
MSHHRRAASVNVSTSPTSDIDDINWFDDAEAVIDYLGDNSPAIPKKLSETLPAKATTLSRASSLTCEKERSVFEHVQCVAVSLAEAPVGSKDQLGCRKDLLESPVVDKPTENHLHANLELAILTIASLQSQLGVATSTNERLRQDLDRLMTSESTAMKAADAAVRTVDVLREQLRVSSHEQLAKVAAPVVDPVEAKRLAELAATKEALTKALWDRDAALAKDKATAAMLKQVETSLFQASVDVAAKTTEVTQLRAAHDALEAELANAKAVGADSQAKLERAMERIDVLSTTAASVSEENTDLHARVMTWQADADAKSAQIQSWQRLVPRLHTELAELRSEWVQSKRVIKQEIKKTQSSLLKWSQDGTDVAIQHNEREVALEAKHAKIAQWQYQVKVEKLRCASIEQQLWKANATYDRDSARWRDEYDRLRDHVNVLLEVKASLATEVRTSLERIQALEATLAHQHLAFSRLKKKQSALQQHVEILQHTHARELERVLLPKTIKSTTTALDAENQGELIPPAWLDFVRLVHVHRETTTRLA